MKEVRKLLAQGRSSRYEYDRDYSGSPFFHHELRLYQEGNHYILTWREVGGKKGFQGDTFEGSTPGEALARLSEAERSEENPSLSRALAALVEEIYPEEKYEVKSESAASLGSLRWHEADWWSGHEGRWQEVTIWEEPAEPGAYTALVAEYRLGAKPPLQRAWVRHGDAVSLSRALAEISRGLYMCEAIGLLLEAGKEPLESREEGGEAVEVYPTRYKGVRLEVRVRPSKPGFPDPAFFRPAHYRVRVRTS